MYSHLTESPTHNIGGILQSPKVDQKAIRKTTKKYEP